MKKNRRHETQESKQHLKSIWKRAHDITAHTHAHTHKEGKGSFRNFALVDYRKIKHAENRKPNIT